MGDSRAENKPARSSTSAGRGKENGGLWTKRSVGGNKKEDKTTKMTLRANPTMTKGENH